MATITTNQHSYSNASALLNVVATASRTDANTVSITANWYIYTAGSSYSNAPRYLVLIIDSVSGEKYYSTVIGTDWGQKTTYSGSYTFTGIPLDAAATSITIGFGVSALGTSLSSSGTLIWNGSSSVSSSTYSSEIQFASITDIEKGYTACVAPQSFTALPVLYEDSFVLSWRGASGGVNNTITGYELQLRIRTSSGDAWSSWADSSITTSGTAASPSISRGGQAQYRIRTKGTAGVDYYSEWLLGDICTLNSLPSVPAYPQISATLVSPGDAVIVSWSASTDADENLSAYQLARSINGGIKENVSKDITISRSVTIAGHEGDLVEFFVCAEDELGATSDWVSLGSVAINSAPAAPTDVGISKTEYSPGDAVEISWDGASDRDNNIICFQIEYGVCDTSGVVSQWYRLTEVQTSDTGGSYTFVPDMAQYHQILNFRIRTVDALGAESDWVDCGTLLRNDNPVVYIRNEETGGYDVGTDGYCMYIFIYTDAGLVAHKYMPYIFANEAWKRLAGEGGSG